MTYDFGKNIKLSVYGGSHEPSVGFSLDGLPARSVISLERLQAFLDRRAPGRNAYTSSRKEADCPVFVKGLHDNTLTGETLIAQPIEILKGDNSSSMLKARVLPDGIDRSIPVSSIFKVTVLRWILS